MIISWSASNTADIFYYAKGLISDLSPLLTIVVGVGVGIFIFWAVVHAIKS